MYDINSLNGTGVAVHVAGDERVGQVPVRVVAEELLSPLLGGQRGLNVLVQGVRPIRLNSTRVRQLVSRIIPERLVDPPRRAGAERLTGIVHLHVPLPLVLRQRAVTASARTTFPATAHTERRLRSNPNR